MVKVSVIVPIYNGKKYLEKCLESICMQTLKDIEIICVDDGSTDGTQGLLRQIAEKDSRIRVLVQENKYAGVARNNGMQHAVGKYLSFLDADDYFEPDMLEKMYSRAETQNCEIVLCRYSTLSPGAKHAEEPDCSYMNEYIADKMLFSGKNLKYKGIFQITKGWAWDKLFRTEYVRRCGYSFPEFRSSEDGFFTYMLLARAERISYLDDVLIVHRINRPDSLSSTKERDWQNGFKMLLMIKAELEKQKLYERYQRSFLNEALNFLKWYLESMHTFGAYRECYDCIKTVLELEMEVLSHDKAYYFKEDLYLWYRTVCSVPLDEYLFLERKRYIESLAEKEEMTVRLQEIISEKDWVFPFHLLEAGKTVVLYGAGKIGQSFYRQLKTSKFCREIIWVDRQYGKFQVQGMDVQNPETALHKTFDFIFLAIKNKKTREDIKKWLYQNGIGMEKIRE